MSFPSRAESLRAKAHLSGVKLPVLIGLTALALLVLVVAGRMLMGAVMSGGLIVEKQGEGAVPTASASTGDIPTEEPSKKIFVHLSGAVAEPGVQEVAEGSRVQDAITAAGGFTQEAAHDALNLARVLSDGEQIIILTQQEVDEAAAAQGALPSNSTSAAASGSGSASSGGKININTASAADLDTLPGVGPSTAEKIVADRDANGFFVAPEDLTRVTGIGDKKYAALADLICVG